MNKDLLDKEMRRYSQQMKDRLIPIMEETLELHGESGSLVFVASILDAFISFLYTVSTPETSSPEERLDKVKELLDYFMLTYAEKEILNEIESRNQ